MLGGVDIVPRLKHGDVGLGCAEPASPMRKNSLTETWCGCGIGKASACMLILSNGGG